MLFNLKYNTHTESGPGVDKDNKILPVYGIYSYTIIEARCTLWTRKTKLKKKNQKPLQQKIGEKIQQ